MPGTILRLVLFKPTIAVTFTLSAPWRLFWSSVAKREICWIFPVSFLDSNPMIVTSACCLNLTLVASRGDNFNSTICWAGSPISKILLLGSMTSPTLTWRFRTTPFVGAVITFWRNSSIAFWRSIFTLSSSLMIWLRANLAWSKSCWDCSTLERASFSFCWGSELFSLTFLRKFCKSRSCFSSSIFATDNSSWALLKLIWACKTFFCRSFKSLSEINPLENSCSSSVNLTFVSAKSTSAWLIACCFFLNSNFRFSISQDFSCFLVSRSLR